MASRPAPVAAAPQRPDPDDEELVDLPPIDEDDGDVPNDGDALDDLPHAREDAGDPFDDTLADDLDVAIEIDEADDGSGESEAAEDAIDVGALDEDIDDPGAEDDDGRDEGALVDDDDVDADDGPGDDGGLEGTDEPIEDEVDDAALPALDADDEGDFEDEALLDGPMLAGEGVEGLPPWSDARWSAVEGAGASVPCRAVATCRGRVAATGDGTWIVDEGAHAARAADEAAGVSLAMTDAAVLLATTRGALLAGAPWAEASLAAIAGWSARGGPAKLAATADRAWALEGGAVWKVAEPSAVAPASVREGGVLAIAASGSALSVLTRGDDGARIERLRGDDEAWSREPLEGAAQRIAEGRAPALATAAGGRAVAVHDEAEGLALSRDGGRRFVHLPLARVLAAVFAGDALDAPLLVLVSRGADGAVHLVRVDVDGDARLVAEVERTTDEGEGLEAAAMAWDPAREVVWIASPAGLAAFGRPSRH
jgi:hypothetical protein